MNAVRDNPAASVLRTVVGFGLGYAAALAVGELLHLRAYGASGPFWPASGVYLAALVLVPARRWPLLLGTAALLDWLSNCVLQGAPLATAASYWVSDSIEPLLGATLLLRVLRRPPDPSRLRDVLLLCALAGMLPGTSLLGSWALAEEIPGARIATVWQVWWLGDLLGILTVGAAILAWRQPAEPGPWRGGRTELLALIGVSAALASLLFFWDLGTAPSIFEPPTLLFPPLVWAAIRFGPRGATTGSTLLALLFMGSTLLGDGHGAYSRLREGGFALLDLVIWMQLALIIAAGIALVLAAAMAERDRAERASQRHRDEIARADKMISLGTLVSSIAHELDNPNQLIMLNLPVLDSIWRDAREVLDDRHRQDPGLRLASIDYRRAREDVERVLRDTAGAADRIRGLVARLRDYSRTGVPQSRPFDLDAAVRDALTLLGSRLKKATRRFELRLAGTLPPVMGDARRMEQVVVNLLLNATEALTDRAQGILLRTDRRGDEVVLEVRDQGHGMTEEQIERVRDPFFTTKETGTGLGLAIVAEIVAEHGGRLRFESAPGRGTTAEVALPALVEGRT